MPNRTCHADTADETILFLPCKNAWKCAISTLIFWKIFWGHSPQTPILGRGYGAPPQTPPPRRSGASRLPRLARDLRSLHRQAVIWDDFRHTNPEMLPAPLLTRLLCGHPNRQQCGSFVTLLSSKTGVSVPQRWSNRCQFLFTTSRLDLRIALGITYNWADQWQIPGEGPRPPQTQIVVINDRCQNAD